MTPQRLPAPAPGLGRSRARALPWLETASLLLTIGLVAVDSGDADVRGLRALVDTGASNIGDPWPTVVAAARLAARFHAPIYDDFNPVGSSFIYPPIAALPFAPFAHLAYEGAHAALAALSRVLWCACAAIAGWLAWNPSRRVSSAVFAVVGAVGFYPLLRAVELNQSTLIVAVPIGASLLCATRGWEGAAGALFAAGAIIKPQLALVVPLLAWRSRRFVLMGGAALVALGLASLAYGGWDNHVRYVTTVLPALSSGYAFYPNQSWSGTLQRLAGASPFEFALATPSPALRAMAAVATLATLVAGGFALRSPDRGAPQDARAFSFAVALAWVTVTLASPISWEHHFTPALFVFALFIRWRDAIPVRARALACLAFPLVAAYVDVQGFHGVLGRLAMSYCLVGGIGLAAALVTVLRSTPA